MFDCFKDEQYQYTCINIGVISGIIEKLYEKKMFFEFIVHLTRTTFLIYCLFKLFKPRYFFASYFLYLYYIYRSNDIYCSRRKLIGINEKKY